MTGYDINTLDSNKETILFEAVRQKNEDLYERVIQDSDFTSFKVTIQESNPFTLQVRNLSGNSVLLYARTYKQWCFLSPRVYHYSWIQTEKSFNNKQVQLIYGAC